MLEEDLDELKRSGVLNHCDTAQDIANQVASIEMLRVTERWAELYLNPYFKTAEGGYDKEQLSQVTGLPADRLIEILDDDPQTTFAEVCVIEVMLHRFKAENTG